MNARTQLHGLTIARGIAAWLVVLFHIRSGIGWLPTPMMAVIGKGYLAVDFFFMLSGFVIYLSAHQAMQEEGVRAIAPFLRRRIARIYPLHAVMLTATVAFALILAATGREASGYPWRELPLHITLTQNWGFTEKLSWNHPAWSISTEMAAYLLFPAIVLATPVARASRWALALGIAGAIAFLAAIFYAVDYTILGAGIPQYGLMRCLLEFTCGTMLCAIWLQCEDMRGAANAVAALVLASSAVLWSLSAAREPWAFPLITAASIFLIAQASCRAEDMSRSVFLRPLIYVGEISYATYLSHFMLFIWFKITVVENAANIPPWQVALYMALTVCASVLLYHGVEKPGRRLGRLRKGTGLKSAQAYTPVR